MWEGTIHTHLAHAFHQPWAHLFVDGTAQRVRLCDCSQYLNRSPVADLSRPGPRLPAAMSSASAAAVVAGGPHLASSAAAASCHPHPQPRSTAPTLALTPSLTPGQAGMWTARMAAHPTSISTATAGVQLASCRAQTASSSSELGVEPVS